MLNTRDGIGFKGLLPAIHHLRFPIDFITVIIRFQQGSYFRIITLHHLGADLVNLLILRPRQHEFLIRQTTGFQCCRDINNRIFRGCIWHGIWIR